MAKKSDPKPESGVLCAFQASLVSGSRKPLTLDGDGEATLVLTIDASQVPELIAHWHQLNDKSFWCVLTEIKAR